MKPLAECLDLIQGKTVEEFTREHPHAVLIGLGVIAGEMQRNPAQAAGTMFLNLSGAPDSGEQGPMVNQVFPVEKVSREVPADGIYIGAGTENDIVLPDTSMSKSHLHLLKTRDGWALVDHGSTNGSFINGTRTEAGVPIPLKGGDIVTVGRFSFTYYDAMSFAKLLFVQAMARGRSRSRPRTPGVARAASTPGRPTPTPTQNPSLSAPAAPWARLENEVPQGPRQTGSQEWQDRAVGKPLVTPLSSGNFSTGGSNPLAGSGNDHFATQATQPLTVPYSTQPPRTPNSAPNSAPNPAAFHASAGQEGRAQAHRGLEAQVPATSWFKRLMRAIARFFNSLAGS